MVLKSLKMEMFHSLFTKVNGIAKLNSKIKKKKITITSCAVCWFGYLLVRQRELACLASCNLEFDVKT